MPVLSAEEVQQALRGLGGWEHRGESLVRTFTLDGFMGSVGFVNRLAQAAEAADHHPDLDIRWNRVTVTLSTHSEGGVTAKDLALAAEADRLATAG
jgi:4a-hydroxytetrahydrobiopterin dehydratase